MLYMLHLENFIKISTISGDYYQYTSLTINKISLKKTNNSPEMLMKHQNLCDLFMLICVQTGHARKTCFAYM